MFGRSGEVLTNAQSNISKLWMISSRMPWVTVAVHAKNGVPLGTSDLSSFKRPYDGRKSWLLYQINVKKTSYITRMIAGYSYDGFYLEPKRAHINKGHLPLRYTVGLIHNHRHYS